MISLSRDHVISLHVFNNYYCPIVVSAGLTIYGEELSKMNETLLIIRNKE